LRISTQGRICGYVGFSSEMEHLIMAGADILIMPSRYEPCGLPQMYAQVQHILQLTATHSDAALALGAARAAADIRACASRTATHTATRCDTLQHTGIYRQYVLQSVCPLSRAGRCTCTHTLHCTLQHTATHCNTLQHSATHSNTTHRCKCTHRCSTHCIALPHTATYCNAL